MTVRVFAAVDVGASAGRVIAGLVGGDSVALREIHRFANGPVDGDGHLRWDVVTLFDEIVIGLRRLVAEHPHVESIGIDTWAVDYGLLDADGTLLADPVAYRDDRTAKVIDEVHAAVSPEELYGINGLQFLPFNTLYQLAAERHGELWDRAATIALIPDLLAYWLTGTLGAERTNASTTGLVDVHTGEWSAELLVRLGLPADRFPTIDAPGAVRGTVLAGLGLPPLPVTTVGSHDTASAVVGVPLVDRNAAYVSSGTWSLVGMELDAPVLSDAARLANFTNETGVDGRTRFLRNEGGLWLLQESLRAWAERGCTYDVEMLLAKAAALGPGGPKVPVGDPAFIPPGGMPARIAAAAAHAGYWPPETPAETVRCIMESLAQAYASTVDRAEDLAGVDASVVHLVGGGSRNELLCQRTADACDRPVLAGPVEATALGNVLVQARAHGAAPGSLEDLRALVSRSFPPRRYDPS